MAVPNTYVAYNNVANTISFAFLNQKKHYDKKHQPLFIKVRDWTILKLHKDYLIFFSIDVTKKLM